MEAVEIMEQELRDEVEAHNQTAAAQQQVEQECQQLRNQLEHSGEWTAQ